MTNIGNIKKQVEEVLNVRAQVPKLTICEVLRRIYFLADELNNEELKQDAILAITMAKKMNNKLVEYKGATRTQQDFNANVWEDNPRYKNDP